MDGTEILGTWYLIWSSSIPCPSTIKRPTAPLLSFPVAHGHSTVFARHLETLCHSMVLSAFDFGSAFRAAPKFYAATSFAGSLHWCMPASIVFSWQKKPKQISRIFQMVSRRTGIDLCKSCTLLASLGESQIPYPYWRENGKAFILSLQEETVAVKSFCYTLVTESIYQHICTLNNGLHWSFKV